MFRCDRGCDGKFGKFRNFVGTKHTPYGRAEELQGEGYAVTIQAVLGRCHVIRF